VGKRQLKRKRVEVKNKNQGHGHQLEHRGNVVANGGGTLAGLFGAALYGDSSMLRELLLDRYAQGGLVSARNNSMANQIARIRDLRRTRQEHEMSRHSAERNHGHVEYGDYENNYEGFGGGLPNYNVQYPARTHYDMGAIGHHYQQVERLRRFGMSPPSINFQRNPAGRSSVNAINLCDDESDFCVVSSSFSGGRSQSSGTHASTNNSSYADFNSSSIANFAFNRDSASASEYGVPLDLTGDAGRGSGVFNPQDHTAIDLTSADDVIDLRSEDSTGLGDLWAVSGAGSGTWPTSSSSSSLSEASSCSSSSSSSTPTPTPDLSFPERISPPPPSSEHSSTSSSSTPNILV
jgi:hypothetical protein